MLKVLKGHGPWCHTFLIIILKRGANWMGIVGSHLYLNGIIKHMYYYMYGVLFYCMSVVTIVAIALEVIIISVIVMIDGIIRDAIISIIISSSKQWHHQHKHHHLEILTGFTLSIVQTPALWYCSLYCCRFLYTCISVFVFKVQIWYNIYTDIWRAINVVVFWML